MECDVRKSGKSSPTFQKNVLPSSWKGKQSKEHAFLCLLRLSLWPKPPQTTVVMSQRSNDLFEDNHRSRSTNFSDRSTNDWLTTVMNGMWVLLNLTSRMSPLIPKEIVTHYCEAEETFAFNFPNSQMSIKYIFGEQTSTTWNFGTNKSPTFLCCARPAYKRRFQEFLVAAGTCLPCRCLATIGEYKVKVKVMLRPTVSRLLWLGIKHPSRD
jgi:hypothetical protein